MENTVRKQRKSNSIRKAALKDKDDKKKEDRKITTVPPVRQNGSIKVKYTPRVFPTPSRESTQEEEQQVRTELLREVVLIQFWGLKIARK